VPKKRRADDEVRGSSDLLVELTRIPGYKREFVIDRFNCSPDENIAAVVLAELG